MESAQTGFMLLSTGATIQRLLLTRTRRACVTIRGRTIAPTLVAPQVPNERVEAMKEIERPHRLTVRIERVGDGFEAWIEEPDTTEPHWTMSGPVVPYEEAVEEVAEALKRHLLSPD